MKEKTYLRMTKKCPLRGLKLFKHKYLTKQRFYALLAKIRLVREVRNTTTKPIRNNDCINKVRLLEYKIKTDRGVFNLSFFCRGERQTHQWWYESIFKPYKKLYTLMDEEYVYIEAEVRSECEEFEVRIDPFNHIRVNRKSSRIITCQPPQGSPVAIDTVLESNPIVVDFLNARLGTKVTLKVDPWESTLKDIVNECVQRATVQMRNYIEGNSEAINEKLIGVKADGEFITSDGQRLIPNCICNKCGNPVFKSSLEEYTAQCLFCDEDLYSIEVSKVDPEKYKEIYEFNKIPLYEILTK